MTLIGTLLTLGLISANQWYVLPKDSSITFVTVDDNTEGTIEGLKAEILFDENQLELSKLTGSVDVSTLKTGIKLRDKHLKSNDYFDAKKYPYFTFSSSKITKTSDGYLADGNLTIKETTKPIQILFLLDKKDKTGFFIGKMTVKWTDFGVPAVKKKGRNEAIVTLKIKTKTN